MLIHTRTYTCTRRCLVTLDQYQNWLLTDLWTIWIESNLKREPRTNCTYMQLNRAAEECGKCHFVCNSQFVVISVYAVVGRCRRRNERVDEIVHDRTMIQCIIRMKMLIERGAGKVVTMTKLLTDCTFRAILLYYDLMDMMANLTNVFVKISWFSRLLKGIYAREMAFWAGNKFAWRTVERDKSGIGTVQFVSVHFDVSIHRTKNYTRMCVCVCGALYVYACLSSIRHIKINCVTLNE